MQNQASSVVLPVGIEYHTKKFSGQHFSNSELGLTSAGLVDVGADQTGGGVEDPMY